MKIIITFLLAIFAIATQGQDAASSTIAWNSTITFDAQKGETVDELTTFVSSPGLIEWRTSDGTLLKSYTVSSITGTWTNVNQSGLVRYDVSESQSNGSITIIRYNSQHLE